MKVSIGCKWPLELMVFEGEVATDSAEATVEDLGTEIDDDEFPSFLNMPVKLNREVGFLSAVGASEAVVVADKFGVSFIWEDIVALDTSGGGADVG